MNTFLRVALFSAVATGAVLLGWRFVGAGSPEPPGAREPSANGDFDAEGHGTGGELTEAQREELLEELENQLGTSAGG